MTAKISAVVVPKWGLEMTEGTISTWLKNPGDPVTRGEPLLEVESDKIVNSVDAPSAGVLRRILLEAGNAGAVGTLIGIIADTDSSERDIDAFIASFRAPPGGEVVGGTSATPATVPATPALSSPSSPTSSAAAQDSAATAAVGMAPVRISPPVRRLADSLGVSLEGLRGTGPNGRILQEDVERVAAARASTAGLAAIVATPQVAEPEETEQPRLSPWSATRRAIARRMLDSAQTIPHFYLVMEVDARPLQILRAQSSQSGAAPSINDLIVHATAHVLPKHPAVNANYADSGLLSFAHAHIAIAVATNEGVVAPVLRFADRLPLAELIRKLAELRQRVTERRLGKGDLEGASFTISNLGMFGIREFTSIITAPQCASLAVGAIRSIGDTTTLSLTLSCDHRAVDGSTGAGFLRDLKDALESV